jgi:hypothetical protein
MDLWARHSVTRWWAGVAYRSSGAIRHNLHYPGYVVRLNDGTMIHAASVNDKHAGMVTLYRGRVSTQANALGTCVPRRGFPC